MREHKPKPRVSRKPSSSTPRVRNLGDRGAKVIANGGEPIYVGRPVADGKIPYADMPFSVSAVRKMVTDEVLSGIGVTRSTYEAGKMSGEQRRVLFLLLYGNVGNVRLCAGAVGASRFQVEAWRMDIENFRRDMDLAYEDCVDELEHLARRRVLAGRPWEEVTDKEVVDASGARLGSVERTTKSGVEHSDGLLMFLLKGQRSRLYGNKTELSGPEGGPIPLKEIAVRVVDPKEPDGAQV